MASAGAEEMGMCTHRAPGGRWRRQFWKVAQWKLGWSGDQTGRSLNVKSRPITSSAGKWRKVSRPAD